MKHNYWGLFFCFERSSLHSKGDSGVHIGGDLAGSFRDHHVVCLGFTHHSVVPAFLDLSLNKLGLLSNKGEEINCKCVKI